MIELIDISVKFRKGELVFTALENINLKIGSGEFCAVTGSSGAGKSTLLNVIGGLTTPDSGKLFLGERDADSMSGKERNIFRKRSIGFIFQQFHLMPYLSVHENISLGCNNKNDIGLIDSYIEKFEMKSLIDKLPGELSTGEKQRVAFLRAIISSPEIILADEPTGNLDPGNSEILMSLIKDFNNKGGTVVLVTHDESLSAFADTRHHLIKGRISK